MKLKHRLIISFCIILFVPIIVAFAVLYGLSLLKTNVQNGFGNNYDYIVSTIQMLNQSAASDYRELSEIAGENPERLTDLEWLEERNQRMEESGGYLIVRVGDEIICNGASDENDIDVSRLPDYGDNEQAHLARKSLERRDRVIERDVEVAMARGAVYEHARGSRGRTRVNNAHVNDARAGLSSRHRALDQRREGRCRVDGDDVPVSLLGKTPINVLKGVRAARLRVRKAHGNDPRLLQEGEGQVAAGVADDRGVLLGHASLPTSASSGRWSARGRDQR